MFIFLYCICIEFLYVYFPVLLCLSVSVKSLAMKTASEMTYIVSGGVLNSTHLLMMTTKAPVFLRQILPNSVVQLLKFREIPWHYCIKDTLHSAVSRHCRIVTTVLGIYKEFIVTCNTKTHYIKPLVMKVHVILFIIIIKVSLQQVDFIVL